MTTITATIILLAIMIRISISIGASASTTRHKNLKRENIKADDQVYNVIWLTKCLCAVTTPAVTATKPKTKKRKNYSVKQSKNTGRLQIGQP
jgi:hypothetical protein